MKKAFILSLTLAFLVSVSVGQEKAKPTPSPKPTPINAIVVYVETSNKAMEVKATDLATLPRKEVKAKDHNGKDVTYSGVEVRDVLKLAGAQFGDQLRGKAMAYFLQVVAQDKYQAIFALPELDDTYTNKIVILADTEDGRPLDGKNGPWQIIVPDEKKHARWVRQVTGLFLITTHSANEGRIPVPVP